LAVYIDCIYKAYDKNLMPGINSHPRPSSNKNRAMDIEQFYIEKRDNFVCFISELRAEWSCGLSLREPGFYNISPD